MNIGHFSKLGYDQNAFEDRVDESTSALNYQLSTDAIYNCDGCLSTLGPRSRFGVSTYRETGPAESQYLTDIDSILSNRNVKASDAKTGKVNLYNLSSLKSHNKRLCNNTLNPENSRLSHPSSNYRDMNVNRFYNLIHNPQEPIFWDFSVNTRLEAKDNYRPDMPESWPNLLNPDTYCNRDTCNKK